MVSILTNNAEGQVGSQSSNLPHSDSSDKKGEEILASNSFEVRIQFIFFPARLPGIFDYFGEEICRGDWQPSKIVFDKFR